MKRFSLKKNLDLEIMVTIVKLSEVEFLGVLRILGISPVKQENGKVYNKTFEEVYIELEEKVTSLKRKQKKNLLTLLTSTARGRDFTGNQTPGEDFEKFTKDKGGDLNATKSKD